METPTINDLDYNAQRVLILGTTGMGKSTCAARLIHLHPADLVLVYDWQAGEFSGRLGADLCHTPEEVAHRIEQGKRIVCYDPEIPFDENMDERQKEDFDWFCRMAMEVAGTFDGPKLLVVDEAHDLMTTSQMPAGLRFALARGRRRQLDSILIAEAANALNWRGRNQMSEVYCFRCVDENALEYPKRLGMEPEEISKLPPTHFYHRDNNNGEIKRLALWEKKSTPHETVNPTKE